MSWRFFQENFSKTWKESPLRIINNMFHFLQRQLLIWIYEIYGKKTCSLKMKMRCSSCLLTQSKIIRQVWCFLYLWKTWLALNFFWIYILELHNIFLMCLLTRLLEHIFTLRCSECDQEVWPHFPEEVFPIDLFDWDSIHILRKANFQYSPFL